MTIQELASYELPFDITVKVLSINILMKHLDKLNTKYDEVQKAVSKYRRYSLSLEDGSDAYINLINFRNKLFYEIDEIESSIINNKKEVKKWYTENKDSLVKEKY